MFRPSMTTPLIHGPLLVAALALTSPACGAEPPPETAPLPAATNSPGDWRFGGGVYLWGASITGDSTSGGEIDISFSNLLDNLNFAGMGTIGVTNDQWTIGADIIYLNVEADNSGNLTLPGVPLDIDTEGEVSMKAWVVTPSLQYRLVDNDSVQLNALVGARYLSIELGLKYKTGTAFGSNTRVNASDSDSVWDGVVGVKGNFTLAGDWYLPYYADVGTGQSNYTWQAFAGVGYRFSKLDAVLGYRYAAWKFDGGGVLDDLQLHGPMLGVKGTF